MPKACSGVMSLGIENAAELTVTAEGSDEAEALEAIADYLAHPEF